MTPRPESVGSSWPPAHGPATAALALCVVALASCATVDEDQARLCRIAVPALEPPQTRVAIRRVTTIEGGVRVDYSAAQGGSVEQARFAECRFALGRAQEIQAISTDRGEVPGATVYLLRRYYIETPEGAAADPGPPPPDAGLPRWTLPAAGLFIALVIALMLSLREHAARTRRR